MIARGEAAMEGHVEEIDDRHVKGWCRGNLEVIIDRRFVFPVTPMGARQDLIDAGIPGAGFQFSVSDALPGYQPSEIIVRMQGTLRNLSNGYFARGPAPTYMFVESDREAREHHDRLVAPGVRSVVLFTARAGGTYLVDALRNHPDAYAFSEPIDLLSTHGEQAAFNWLHDLFVCPSRVEYFRTVETPRLMLISSKIAGNQVALMRCFEYFRVRYIRLYRQNVVKQAISHFVAAQMHATTHDFNTTRDVGDAAKVVVNPIHLLSVIESLVEAEKVVDDMIRRHTRGRVLAVSYEEVVGSTQDSAFGRIFEFLEVEPIQVRARFRKVTPSNLAEVVVNFDQVRREIGKTRFRTMLEED